MEQEAFPAGPHCLDHQYYVERKVTVAWHFLVDQAETEKEDYNLKEKVIHQNVIKEQWKRRINKF